MRWLSSLLVLLVLVGLVSAGTSSATVITLEAMNGPDRAREMANKLQGLPGVQEVRLDLEAHTVTVFPQVNLMLSPRVLWQTVEETRHRPIRLQGPHGLFTSMPPQ